MLIKFHHRVSKVVHNSRSFLFNFKFEEGIKESLSTRSDCPKVFDPFSSMLIRTIKFHHRVSKVVHAVLRPFLFNFKFEEGIKESLNKRSAYTLRSFLGLEQYYVSSSCFEGRSLIACLVLFNFKFEEGIKESLNKRSDWCLQCPKGLRSFLVYAD